jgi:predicted PurR-regulated permease PerM
LDLAGRRLLIAVLLYLLQHPFAVPGGILLAYLADPLVDRLERAGLSRTWGVVVVFSLFTLMFMALLLVLVPMLAKQLVRCTSWRRRCSTGCSTWPCRGRKAAWAWPMASGSSTRSRPRSASTWARPPISSVLLSQATASSLALIGWLANLVLIPVVGFYLLRDWDLMMAKLRSLLPRQREEQVVGLAGECHEVLGRSCVASCW